MCTLGAHEARQDQAAERKETFLCIHEYHSDERARRKKTAEVNDFSVCSSVQLRLPCPLVDARSETRKSSIAIGIVFVGSLC